LSNIKIFRRFLKAARREKMKRLTVAMIISAALVSFGAVLFVNAQKNIKEFLGIDGKYDTHLALVGMVTIESLNTAMKFLPTVAAQLKIQTMPNIAGIPEGFESGISQKAAGVLFGGRYLLTVEHVMRGGKIDFQTSFGIRQVPTYTVDAKYTGIIANQEFKLKKIGADHEQDWALFEVVGDIRSYQAPFKIGKSEELKAGHMVYIMGRPIPDVVLKNSIISATSAREIVAVLPKVNPDEVLIVAAGIYPGDSGGPVYALRDGQPELVGIINAGVINTTIGFVLKIRPLLEKIHERTGINLGADLTQ
jgi:S1-C subfamily serine protease